MVWPPQAGISAKPKMTLTLQLHDPWIQSFRPGSVHSVSWLQEVAPIGIETKAKRQSDRPTPQLVPPSRRVVPQLPMMRE